jgi:hypothetical protein
MCQKSPKRDAFSLFQSKTSIFHDEETSFMPFPSAKEGNNGAAAVSKVHHLAIQKQKATRQTHTHRHPK